MTHPLADSGERRQPRNGNRDLGAVDDAALLQLVQNDVGKLGAADRQQGGARRRDVEKCSDAVPGVPHLMT